MALPEAADSASRKRTITRLPECHMNRRLHAVPAIIIAALCVLSPISGRVAGAGDHPQRVKSLSFTATTGNYTVSFRPSNGAVLIKPRGKSASLAIRELQADRKLDLLYSVNSVRHVSSTYILKGKTLWAAFAFTLSLYRTVPGLVHLTLTLQRYRNVPSTRRLRPDVQLIGAPATSLKTYAPAAPVAGSSIFLSAPPLDSSILYLADLTRLGPYFDRTRSGASQPVFEYPNAGGKGALVGSEDDGSFGYVEPIGSLDNLPLGRPTVAVDSYLYVLPGVPANETDMADTYLKLLGAVHDASPQPTLPAADWKSLAEKEAHDLSDPANWSVVDGKSFLRSYVSDSRNAPELITQLGVLVGLRAFENRFHEHFPIADTLEQGLAAFYSPTFHSVVHGLASHTDATATEESWYYLDYLISLYQVAQLGSMTSRQLLLDSADAAITLAHQNGYEFPQTFHYSDWNGQSTGVQPDVAGGYAWLMLGLYDLTKNTRYLDEAKASIAHLAGKGFALSYEPHMTAYGAAAAQRLFTITGDVAYRGYARLALANLFHLTRLWDCTYGTCHKASGYHTYFGLDCLPTCDYIAMLEQYEAWLGLRDYVTYARDEPSYVLNLVRGFLTNTPRALQYALPPLLPTGAATGAPSQYGFVPANHLNWYIPLEDLRAGDATSGAVGQEIYGAGGPLIFAADG
jgi:hypothetical protein